VICCNVRAYVKKALKATIIIINKIIKFIFTCTDTFFMPLAIKINPIKSEHGNSRFLDNSLFDVHCSGDKISPFSVTNP